MTRQLFTPALAGAASLLLAACDLPRDADGTMDRIRAGHRVRVGFVVDTPWVTDSGGIPGGVEPALVSTLARGLGARVEWAHGSETRLMEALHQRELDLVIGGLRPTSPWARKVAFTRPFYEDSLHHEPHVMAVSPGENAWMVAVERSLESQKDRASRMMHGRTP